MTTQTMNPEELSLRDEVLTYATKLQASEPTISLETLRQKLNAKFATQLAVDPSTLRGALNNPLDVLEGLSKIISAIAIFLGKREPKPQDHAEVIRGVFQIF